jgi:hypothetical protein
LHNFDNILLIHLTRDNCICRYVLGRSLEDPLFIVLLFVEHFLDFVKIDIFGHAICRAIFRYSTFYHQQSALEKVIYCRKFELSLSVQTLRLIVTHGFCGGNMEMSFLKKVTRFIFVSVGVNLVHRSFYQQQ